MSKPIQEMSREELLAEIEMMQGIKVPASPVAKAPKRPREVKPKAGRRASWRDELFGDEEPSSS